MENDCSDEWIALARASEPLAVICTPWGREGRRPFERLYWMVRDHAIAYRPVGDLPGEARLAGLTPLSSEWWEALEYSRERWGDGEWIEAEESARFPHRAYYTPKLNRWQKGQLTPFERYQGALQDWILNGGLEVRWADVDRLIRQIPVNDYAPTQGETHDLGLAPTWHFPEALAYAATGSLAEAATMLAAWSFSGPATPNLRTKPFTLLDEVALIDRACPNHHDLKQTVNRDRLVCRLAYVTAADHCKCSANSLHPALRWQKCSCLGGAWSRLHPLLHGLNSNRNNLPTLTYRPSIATFEIGWPDGANDIWVHRQDVQRLRSDVPTNLGRAPSVKTGHPPSDSKITEKAKEMKLRGNTSYEIASKMRHEPGFENVGTSHVRALIKGLFPVGRRKEKPAHKNAS